MKNNNFLKHFVIIGSGSAINLLIGLLTTPLITRIVNPEEYGKYSLFTMYSNIAVMILCLGLDQALVRYYYEKKDTNYKKALLYNCVILPIAVSLILGIFITILAITSKINFEFSIQIIILLCLYTLIQIVYRFSQLLLRLEYKSKLYSLLSIILKVAYIVIAIPLLLLLKKEYLFILCFSICSATLICLLISIFYQRNMWKFSSLKSKKIDIKRTELLKYSLPFIITMGVTTLFQAIDKISLNYYCTYAEVGIYSSTMSLVHIFAIIQNTFNTLWQPMAVKHYSDNPNDKSFYQKGNQIITVVMFFFGLTLILVKDVFAVLLGEKYREAAYILPFLIFNPIMYTISETTVGGLIFKKKSNLQVFSALGACITNIIGNIILVPRLGCKGAAISTGISYVVFFSLRTILANKQYYVDYKLKKFYFITFLSMLYAFYNTFYKFSIVSIVGYLISIIVLIILYKNTIIYGMKYGKKQIKNMIVKMKKGEKIDESSCS